MYDVSTKLFSHKAIIIATFFGGPLAAGYMIKKNFIAQGNIDYANRTFLFSIVLLAMVLTTLFALPEDVVDKIPNTLFPLLYMLLVHVFNKKYHGEFLEQHAANTGRFYSGWDVVKITIVALVVTLLLIIALLIATDI